MKTVKVKYIHESGNTYKENSERFVLFYEYIHLSAAFKAEFVCFINLNSWFSDKFEKFKILQIIVLSF